MPDLHRPAGTAADGGDPLLITPERAGWTYTGLRVIHLAPGQSRTLVTGTAEMAVLPLSGSCVVECEGRRFEVTGRPSVFTRVTDFAYVPRDAEVRIESPSGGEFALPMAECTRRLDPAYGPAEEVPVEVRGAGSSTRQLTNFLAPEAFPADKLISVEALVPDGNWASYPPHKHDEEREGEAVLEEIYYFRLPDDRGFGVHRTYTYDGEIDDTVTVRDGDVYLIPRGYHGPNMAAPGYDLYFLNVLAGPAEERTMAFTYDPAYAWIAEAWAKMAPDPRVPLTGPEGPRR